MTDYQRELLQQLLDVNWEIQTGHHNRVVLEALQDKYARLEDDLKEDMGRDEYAAWFANAKRMFA